MKFFSKSLAVTAMLLGSSVAFSSPSLQSAEELFSKRGEDLTSSTPGKIATQALLAFVD